MKIKRKYKFLNQIEKSMSKFYAEYLLFLINVLTSSVKINVNFIFSFVPTITIVLLSYRNYLFEIIIYD